MRCFLKDSFYSEHKCLDATSQKGAMYYGFDVFFLFCQILFVCTAVAMCYPVQNVETVI